MDAVKFLQEKRRMCKQYDLCEKCGIGKAKDNLPMDCMEYTESFPEVAVKIVEKWSEENPPKTLLDLFKEQHPNAPLDEDGSPRVCPYQLGYTSEEEDDSVCSVLFEKCVPCWNRPAKEN